MTRAAWAGVLCVLGLAAVACWLHARTPAMADLGARLLQTSPAAASTPGVPAPGRAARAAAPDRPPAAASAAPVVPRLDDRAALRAAFERAPDLYELSEALAPGASAGNANALWTLSLIHDYCAGFAASPAGYARDTALLDGLGASGATAMGQARTRIAQRCGRFVPGDGLGVITILHQREAAAEAGHLAAEASLLSMGAPLDDSAEYQRNLVERVRGSGDPEAYSALSEGMGVAASSEPGLSDPDLVAGTQMSELAWQLAACRSGLDCGPQSSMMTMYCANGGVCSQDPAQDFQTFVYDAAIPRQGTDVVDGLVKRLLQGSSEPQRVMMR